jgi:DNA (cytosine-5)-methyltransferase 1
MMAHVDLCSGIGGFALGFEWAGLSKPVLFCDIELWSRKVLAKHWPDVPIAEDVKELANDPARLVPDCDILTAGYPCQPFSVAGKQRGAEDDRHIWPEIFRIIQAKRPTWIVCENVSGHISLGLNRVLSDLEDKAGYAVQTFCVGAVSVNAPHRRQRIWIIAHTNSHGEPNGTINEQRLVADTNDKGLRSRIRGSDSQSFEKGGKRRDYDNRSCTNGKSENITESQNIQKNLADTNGEGLQGHLEQQTKSADTFVGCGEDVADTDSKRGRLRNAEWQNAEDAGQPPRCQKHGGWDFEPPVGRVAHGIPKRVDRLRGLGNAIVPQIAMQIGLTIKAVRDDTR